MKPSEMNILVVEDDDFQRGIIVKMLQSFGILSIANATDGIQALEIIRAGNGKSVDVVISDLNMPKMDGLEFIRHLGEENINIAIIIASSLGNKLLASAGAITQMYGIKLLGVIEKPITLVQLRSLLSTFERAEVGGIQPTGTPGFTLDEILKGIRDKQFEPYFQPKINLKNGRLAGAETLARWIHPERGVIAANAFIPLLEQSSNLDELTFLMLEKTAAVSNLFQEKKRPLMFSVNLSLASLDDTALADKITRIVRAAGIEPKSIILEITESAAMTDNAQSLENLARLCMNGFQLAIDDYGTGVSSLHQLMRIPFGELKIDQSFIRNMANNSASRIVVESSINMAQKLQVKSVAQGIEAQQDWDKVKSFGCDIAQGYFISEPLDMREFYNFAGRWKENSTTDASASAVSTYNPTKLKILIVDAEDLSRKLTADMLGFLGYSHVSRADSAMAAIKLLEFNIYDLIITDIYMPKVNGLELIQQIRMGKTHAKPDTRIMIITAAPISEVLKSALALNLNEFVVKPVTPTDMEGKLRKCMFSHAQLKSPADYETINVDLVSLESIAKTNAVNPVPDMRRPLKENEYYLLLRRIAPGMILRQSLTLSDGTLLWSEGHEFTELSIKRMNDLKSLLLEESIIVYVPPKADVLQA